VPEYTYKCERCGRISEEKHGMLDNPDVYCPVCRSSMNKMIVSKIDIIFNGHGFFRTDNRKKERIKEC
jgi:putative FmdB family regulatory protein